MKQIELFLELGYITDCVSIFHLGKYREKLLDLEGYKEKSVNNLLEAIERARQTTLDRVFVALGIPNVGKKTAKILAEWISPRLSENLSIMDVLGTIDSPSLEEVHDIGPETATSIVRYIEDHHLLIERLLHELSLDILEKKGLI